MKQRKELEIDTKHARMESYWGLHYGHEAWLKDMDPAVEHIVFQYLREGEAVGQYSLPGMRPEGDMLLQMPKKVQARQEWERNRVEEIKEELRHAISIPNK